MSGARRRSDVVRDVLLLALAACGGALDAASYLRTHAFIANVTGDTIVLGLAAGGRHLSDAAHAGAAIAAFAVGAFCGTALGDEATNDDPWPKRVGRPFALEVVLLVAYAACWTLPHLDPVVLLAVGAAAMGVQSGITHDIHLSGASTTYMTGTVARTAEFFADTLRFGFRGGMVLNAAAWIVYVLAAILVGAIDRAGAGVVPVLCAVVVVVAAVALCGRPLVMRAHRGDREQSG